MNAQAPKKPTPNTAPIDTSVELPKTKTRSPEYQALGLYKRANAIDERMAVLAQKVSDAKVDRGLLDDEVAKAPEAVRIVFKRLRGEA